MQYDPGPVAQLDRALASEARGSEFESQRDRSKTPKPDLEIMVGGFSWVGGINIPNPGSAGLGMLKTD